MDQNIVIELSNIFNKEKFMAELGKHGHGPRKFKKQYRSSELLLEQAFNSDQKINSIIQVRSKLIDTLIIQAWQYIGLPTEQEFCLIATGGYGRQELHPYSDVDLLILVADDFRKQYTSVLESLITFLWDIGFQISQSVRSLEESIHYATSDLSTATSLLDRRYLLGNKELYAKFVDEVSIQKLWDSQKFFTEKLAEQKLRYQKYGNTSYNLEPNIKEGPGGLRDIQMILWIAKQRFSLEKIEDLVEHGFLTSKEVNTLIHGQYYLCALRTALHHLCKHKEERLLFDHQLQLAQNKYGTELANNMAVERFMQTYYRTVKEMNELNDLLMQLFQEIIFSKKTLPKPVKLNDRFQVRNDVIEINDSDVFKNNPSSLLEIFVCLAKNPQLQGVRASTIRQITRWRDLIDAEFRDSPKNHKLFIELFQQKSDISRQLRLMNRYGILGRYLPAFGNIIGQMQYDLYHLYTVDRHLIAIVQNVCKFSEEPEQFPLCYQLLKQIPKREILLLAALFHDLGKGQGGDHSEIGAKLADEFCRQHEIDDYDRELMMWLVEKHLVMSNTAQRKDIYDPDVIAEFAETVKYKAYLDHLYILTCADLIATNDNLWNSWRDSLLRDLYKATEQALISKRDQKIKTATIIQAIKQESMAILLNSESELITEEAVTKLWEQWNKTYFLHHEPVQIASHTQAVLEHMSQHSPLILTSTYHNQGGTEIFINLPDQNYIFANTTAILDSFDLNIVDAQIITTHSGFTLDSYVVIDRKGKAIKDEKLLANIRNKLKQQLTGQIQPPHITNRRQTRRQRHFKYPSKINFSQDQNRNRTIMELNTPDRSGLLAKVGMAFAEANVRLQSAKIATLGEKVEDLFYITDQNHQLIADEEKLEFLRRCVRKYLD